MSVFDEIVSLVGCPRCSVFAGVKCRGTRDYPDAVCLIRWSLVDAENHDPGDEDRR